MSVRPRGPVYAGNFPDPFVLHVPQAEGVRFYAYATNGELGNVQVLTSPDLRTWVEVGDAMPQLASWVRPGRTWAPEVLARPDGRYVLYYTAHCARDDRQAVGVAVSDAPTGPFVDTADAPLVCQADEGGSIDASPFVDADGVAYLLWKNDGNAIGRDTWIYVQRLSPTDATTLVGPRTRLIRQDQAWEGDLVEGPFLWRRDGRYYLFYAANAFRSDRYAEGYAVGPGPEGPFVKAPENPILSSGPDVVGPGHASMVEHEGRTWLAYHGWLPGRVGEAPGRLFWIDEVVWDDGRPSVRPG